LQGRLLKSSSQGPYFTALDLSELARQIDAQEQQQLPNESESQNYDDSGYFSIQVMIKALQIWNLELIPLGSQDAHEAARYPTREIAYICNLDNHWFCLRRFGLEKKQWYNLDSLQPSPNPITDSYLGLFIAQLQNDGYSIFIVRGVLPMNEADEEVDSANLIKDDDLEKAIALSLGMDSSQQLDEDDMLQAAISESLKTSSPPKPSVDEIRQKRLQRFGG
jgi:ataxin-3